MLKKSDLTKEDLYNSVRTLVESKDSHIHLSQQKIYTLFSIGFQYLLYNASKDPGIYIIRAEDRMFAEKLARKAKDTTTRKFMSRLLINRKLRFEKSYIFLDYFSFQSWTLTSSLPKDKIKRALVIKSTNQNPLIEENDFRQQAENFETLEFGESYYINTLKEICCETLTISYGGKYPDLKDQRFDFIPEPEEVLGGVQINDQDIDTN